MAWNVHPDSSKEGTMGPVSLVAAIPPAAIGYSIIYLLLGGGVFGAFLIFIVAKMLGR